jgi:predicted nucleotidyltransferase
VRAGAQRAVAFGSFARGTQDAHSDLDLAVVLETDLPRLERHLPLAGLFEASPVGLDLLVYTPEEFERGVALGYDIFDAIRREGVTIHQRRP